jgi:hypothetical protein
MIGYRNWLCFLHKALLNKLKLLLHIDVVMYENFFDYHKSTVNPLIVNEGVVQR